VASVPRIRPGRRRAGPGLACAVVLAALTAATALSTPSLRAREAAPLRIDVSFDSGPSAAPDSGGAEAGPGVVAAAGAEAGVGASAAAGKPAACQAQLPGGFVPAGGFVRDPKGRIATIQPPGACVTKAYGVNNHGQVVGSYRAGGYLIGEGTVRGFHYKKGRLATFGLPGLDRPGVEATVTDIDDRGRLLGSTLEVASGAGHGFLRDTDGRITIIDHPDATVSTVVQGLNDLAQLSGLYDRPVTGGRRASRQWVLGAAGLWSSMLPDLELSASAAPPAAGRVAAGRPSRRAANPGTSRAAGSSGGAGDPGTGAGADTRPRTPIPGFLLDHGRYTRFDAPRARGETTPLGINNLGQVVGSYTDTDADATYHGFLRDPRGRITTIDIPGARATVASRINDRGQIVGRYYQTAAFRAPDARSRGFLLDRGRLTRIDVPGAVATQAVGIDSRGRVVGEYQDDVGGFHGFLRDERGRFTTIDLPGAAATSLVDINNAGQVLGGYLDPAGGFHNFLLDRGCFTTFDAPGVPFTFARDLNDRGQIAGFTLTALATLAGARGFLLAGGVTGPFTPVDVPGAPRDAVSGLDDSGRLVGYYEVRTRSQSVRPSAFLPGVVNIGDMEAGRLEPEAGSIHAARVPAAMAEGFTEMVRCVGR
jgi:uncharacterized membrane protein